ncbi:MAG: cyanophycin synthetase [Bacteroidales bacterium]
MNIMAAVCVTKILQVPDHLIESVVNRFKGLPHRLEYVGKFKGIHFYNDSIATIPEATMHAVRVLKNVDTLILGGVDRGIDYQLLIDFLPGSGITNLILYGKAGERISEGLTKSGIPTDKKIFIISQFDELPAIIRTHTLTDHVCLLSPAAASYDLFKNFEERGDAFKKIAENL